MHELQIPIAVMDDQSAKEILRVWISDNGQQFSIKPGTWPDPAGWGLLFVDIARQVAEAYSQGNNEKYIAVLERILSGVKVESEDQSNIPKIRRLPS
jgi:uncharacterized protein YbdZ (MbtH family)